MRDRRGVGAVDAVLEEHHAGDLRVVARREEHEPAVVAQVLAALGAPRRALVRDHLRGAGLAAHVVPGIRARPPCRRALTTIHMPSRIAWSFSGAHVDLRLRRRRRHRLQSVAVVHRLDEVRRDARAAVGERRRVDRQRDRRHRHLPLADGDRNRLARVPLLLMLRALSTRVDGTSPVHLVRQVDVRFHAEPEQRRPLVDAIDAEHVADGVEVHVARLLDGVAQIDRAVPALLPALEVAPVEVRAAAAVHLEVGRDDALLEPGEADRHLEGGPGRVAPLERAVLQRLQLVGVERRPGRAVDAGRRTRSDRTPAGW